MAKVPARLRAVTYSLSPMRTGVMHGLFKDWAAGMAKRVKENAVDVGVFCALPLGATVWCVPRARDDAREDETRVESMRESDSRADARVDATRRLRDDDDARAKGRRRGSRFERAGSVWKSIVARVGETRAKKMC